MGDREVLEVKCEVMSFSVSIRSGRLVKSTMVRAEVGVPYTTTNGSPHHDQQLRGSMVRHAGCFGAWSRFVENLGCGCRIRRTVDLHFLKLQVNMGRLENTQDYQLVLR